MIEIARVIGGACLGLIALGSLAAAFALVARGLWEEFR